MDKPGIKLVPANSSAFSCAPLLFAPARAQTSMPNSTTRSSGSSAMPFGNVERLRGARYRIAAAHSTTSTGSIRRRSCDNTFAGPLLLEDVKLDRDLHAVSGRTTHRHDDSRLVMFAAFGDDHALRASLLTHHRCELAQQQFTRRNCFRQTQRQQLRQRRLFLGAFRSRASEKFQSLPRARSVFAPSSRKCSTRGSDVRPHARAGSLYARPNSRCARAQ